MTEEIPIWVDGSVHWLSGADRRTTCRDVLELFAEGVGGCGDISSLALIERWREVERPLDLDTRLLKIWSHWGDEKKDVRLCLRRVDHEADSGRGSPVGATPSLRRRRNRMKTKPWGNQEGLHPRRLAELGGIENIDYEDYQRRRLNGDEFGGYALGEKIYARTNEADHVKRKTAHKSCGNLHSTVIEGKQKKCCSKKSGRPRVRNSENIEKLMKLIIAQGTTIQSQLQKLREREDQIEVMEVKRHKEREEKNGRNYLLETYLESLKEAEVPATDEEKGNDSGVHTEAGSEQTNTGWDVEKGKEKVSQRLERAGSGTYSKRISRRETPKQVCKNPEIPVDIPLRSKSECRNVGEKMKTLKRTQSENDLTENSEIEKPVNEATKEEPDDVVELRRVQSQVEMWEKVLRINKKLEREEENLVRLHIQIRRIQSENIKLVKDQSCEDPQAQSLQKQLEVLRNDLDQNSKEIYNNFTQLIEEDERVVQKQNHLTALMSDLDRTDKEHEMLSEMVAVNCEDLELPPPPIVEENIGISIQVKGQEKISPSPDLMSDLPLPPDDSTLCQSQSIDEESVKPKILKISFDENVQDSENVDKPKDPSPEPSRSIRGILKNRNPDSFYVSDLEKVPVNYGSNISFEDSGCQKVTAKSTSLQPQSSVYARPVQTYTSPHHQPSRSLAPRRDEMYSPVQRREAIYVPGSPPSDIHYQQVPVPSPSLRREDAFLRPQSTTPTGYPVVTTKAVVHNDTDSSGSSDTSGLSSMYSASPTVDEPTYILNTLV